MILVLVASAWWRAPGRHDAQEGRGLPGPGAAHAAGLPEAHGPVFNLYGVHHVKCWTGGSTSWNQDCRDNE